MKIFKHILNFLLITTLIIGIFLNIGKSILLNEFNVKKHLTEINYYEDIYFDIKERFENNTLETGLNVEDLTATLDQELIIYSINNMIEAIYQNKTLELDEQTLKSRLDETINDALTSAGITPNKEERKSIDLLEERLIDIYKEEITIAPSMISKCSQIIIKVQKIVTIVNIVLSVITIILLLLIIILNKRPLKELGICTTSVCIISTILYFITKNSYQNILIISKTISKLIISIIDKFCLNVMVIGLIMLILGLIMIIFSHIKFQRKNNLPLLKPNEN